MQESGSMNPQPSSRPDRIGVLLETLSAVRVGWIGVHEEGFYPKGAEVPWEVVPTNRLIALEKGELVYRFEGEELVCREGALWLVPEWTHRSWRTGEGCRIIWAEFAAPPGMGALPMVYVNKQPWSDLRQVVANEKEPIFQEMALKLLLMRLLREGDWRNNPVQGDLSLPSVVELLRANLHEPGLLGQLPGKLRMSPRQLRDRFRNALGMSPGRYLEMLRMQQARYLLLTTDRSVKEVAALTGFDDPLYFSRRYRRFWNHSPKRHRTPNP